jgi:alanine racemase
VSQQKLGTEIAFSLDGLNRGEKDMLDGVQNHWTSSMTDFTVFHEPDDAFSTAPLRLTVHLGAIAENWRDMAKRSGKARAAAVVKADAYGLGIEDVGQTLYHAGARDFFVAVPSEGVTLRAYAPDARIFVLCGIWPGQEQVFFENDLVPVIASEEQLAFWMAVLAERGDHPCALQVDTGFNRLGLPMEDALALASDVSRPASFSPVLVMSHLACGDDTASPMNARQLQLFRQVSSAFEDIESSLSASAGIFLGSDYHFNLTRPGIALYGGEAVNGATNPMRPVVKAEARILQVREAKAGETVSYGGTLKLTRDSRLAVASVGYADGWLRSLSGSGVPLRDTGISGATGYIAGRRVPVAGRVTMDITIFDVTDIPANEVRAGDYIELFGSNISLDEAAQAAGTIGYEMLTGLGLRYERLYVEPME